MNTQDLKEELARIDAAIRAETDTERVRALNAFRAEVIGTLRAVGAMPTPPGIIVQAQVGQLQVKAKGD